MRLTAGSDHAVHDAMKSPPEMLQIADYVRLMLSLRQMMMDMQATAGVYPRTDILDDLQGFRKDAFDFIPDQRSRFDLQL